MKKFGIVIATVIVMALTGCGSKEKTTTADKAVVEASTEVTTEETTTEVTTEEVVKTTEEKEEKTTESVAQTTTVAPVQPTSSQPTTQTSTPKPAQQTSSQTSTPAPTTTEAPKPTQSTSTQKPATTEAPVHQHTWTTRTETVTEAWTETVEHSAVTHTERVPHCHYCGGYYADIYAHQDQYQETNVEHAIAGWSTGSQTIVDQEAWTETINHPAVTKTVEYCTECGAIK